MAGEWNSKCTLRIKYRKQLAHQLATLDEWESTGLCRAAAMDQLMDQFDDVLKLCDSMWDLSGDEIVLDCIVMMEKLLATFKAGTKKQGDRLKKVDYWKDAIKNSIAQGKKTAPGSMFLPVLGSVEKAVCVSVGAALLGRSSPAATSPMVAPSTTEEHKPNGLYAKEAMLARACVAQALKEAEHLAKRKAVSQGHNVNIQLRAIKAATKIPDEHLASGVGATDVLEPLHKAFTITVDVFSKQEPWTLKAVNLGSMIQQAVGKATMERPAFKRLFNECVMFNLPSPTSLTNGFCWLCRQLMELHDVLKRRGRGKRKR